MNKKEFFQFSFFVLNCFIIIDLFLALTIFIPIHGYYNYLMLSWHPDFFIGLLFGIAFFGSAYLGWLKKYE
jgi:hypothetical protein